ncbi:hypothetical protein Tco_0533574 [Tanacetum coccineum]
MILYYFLTNLQGPSILHLVSTTIASKRDHMQKFQAILHLPTAAPSNSKNWALKDLKARRKIDFDKKESTRAKGGNDKQRYSSFKIQEIGKKEEDSKALIIVDTLVDWTEQDGQSDGVHAPKDYWNGNSAFKCITTISKELEGRPSFSIVPTGKPKVPVPVPTGRQYRSFPVPTDRGDSPSENAYSDTEDEGIFDSGCSRSMAGLLEKGQSELLQPIFKNDYYDIQKAEPKDTSSNEGDDTPHDSAEEIFQQELARLKGQVQRATADAKAFEDLQKRSKYKKQFLLFLLVVHLTLLNDEPTTRFPSPSDLGNMNPHLEEFEMSAMGRTYFLPRKQVQAKDHDGILSAEDNQWLVLGIQVTPYYFKFGSSDERFSSS